MKSFFNHNHSPLHIKLYFTSSSKILFQKWDSWSISLIIHIIRTIDDANKFNITTTDTKSLFAFSFKMYVTSIQPVFSCCTAINRMVNHPWIVYKIPIIPGSIVLAGCANHSNEGEKHRGWEASRVRRLAKLPSILFTATYHSDVQIDSTIFWSTVICTQTIKSGIENYFSLLRNQ